jgi:hypothetical protein
MFLCEIVGFALTAGTPIDKSYQRCPFVYRASIFPNESDGGLFRISSEEIWKEVILEV